MAHLTLAAVSEDGKRLLLVSDTGDEHTLEIDSRLRAALRGETARIGQLETHMDSALRPRDIQARIRAGETPESVAEAANTSVDRIMPFAGPVLAEREHVAQRAQRSSVRRRNSEGSGTARTLGNAVESHLRGISVDADSVEWDSWRRDDGRWVLTAAYATARRSGTGHFTFDMPGNYVVPEDDDAHWLVGDVVEAPAAARNDLEDARQRRLTSLRPDEAPPGLPLGEDAIELVSEPEPAAERPMEAFLDARPDDEEPQAEAAADAAALDADPEPEAPAAAAQTTADAQPEPEPAPDEEPELELELAPEPPPRRTARKRGGRASVPSWDEIMFGGGKQD
ncbi:DUF3071 domain-containing protein [Nocardioides sp. dk4132]|uniref:septation protein SepH n=1 Tax=unclassified Nocardioides TaxID=2615069 RepID=UPI001297A1E0|nr:MULTISPECIES: septation protein SepH [unclassified Nocardioides]MQW76330.1 DUF3071 domain-containing protein [Nocardioides sp. dk4132]QGA07390.1 DUF3071 domain-containing protein [Nocardioides sp. dk884]